MNSYVQAAPRMWRRLVATVLTGQLWLLALAVGLVAVATPLGQLMWRRTQGLVGQVTCSAQRSGTALVLGATVAVVACTGWAVRRVYSVETAIVSHGTQFAFIFTLAFVALVWQMVLCNLERPWKVTRAQAHALGELHVWSMSPPTTRTLISAPLPDVDHSAVPRPDFISVTDDGSKVDY